MQDVAVQQNSMTTSGAPSIQRTQLPLSFVSQGETARVSKVRGKSDLHHHLETLGFVEGAVVKVVTETAGNLIVEIKGAQVALNKEVALKIITT